MAEMEKMKGIYKYHIKEEHFFPSEHTKKKLETSSEE